MKKQLINEVERMQQLAGMLKEEEQEQPLTREEMVQLESDVENFLNEAVFSKDIVSKETLAIEFIIDSLKNRISYY
jgi:hypothetical protein